MSPRVRNRAFIGGFFVLIVLGLIWSLRQPSPDKTATELVAHMKSGDWGGVYDLASKREKDLQDWGRSEFIALMTDISANRIGEIVEISTDGDWQRQVTRKYFHFYIKSKSSNGKMHSSWMALPIYRDVDDWKPEIHSIPLQLYSKEHTPTRPDLAYLVSACRKAGVKAFVRSEDGLESSVDRIAEFLEGTRKWQDVPRYHSGQ